MNDFIFYWMAWLCWSWATWMMDKGKQRTQIAALALFAIIFASYSFTIFQYNTNLSVLFFLCLAIYLLFEKSPFTQIYLYCSSIVISLGYAALYLFSIYDPISLLFPFAIIASVYFILMITIFTKPFKYRLALLFLSAPLGEIAIGIILNHLHLNNEIGMNGYLAIIAITFFSLIFFMLAKSFLQSFERFIIRLKQERKNVL